MIMKKYIIVCFAGLFVFMLSCKKGDFLDKSKDLSKIDEAQIFSDSTKIFEFLNGMYADARFSFKKRDYNDQTNKNQTTDDEECRLYGTQQPVAQILSGLLSSSNFHSHIMRMWNIPWANIRRANLMLSHVPTLPLSEPLKQKIKGETKFLRAWYYSHLLNTFGAMPILGDVVFDAESDINFPRTPYGECVDYLVNELDEAASLLPVEHEAKDFGRVTKNACLGLKSRVLLFAASPLFNGGLQNIKSQFRIQDNIDERINSIAYSSYDQNRWQRAAEAARAVINSGHYELEDAEGTSGGKGFYDLFLNRLTKEQVFFIPQTSNYEFENYWNPPSRSGGWYGFPTQNLVNCFPMKNGKAISDPTSGYNPQNPYVNRDPRMGYTVMYNGSLWAGSTPSLSPVYTYLGTGQTNDNLDTTFLSVATVTGYYCRKMCKQETSNMGGNQAKVERSCPLLRYAEILLINAEASNEAGDINEAYNMLKALRKRAGIEAGSDNMYGLKNGMSKEEMREVVRNERRIELAFEDSRFYDLRRWMIAMDSLNGFNKAMKILRVGTTGSNYTYQEVNITNEARRRVFRPEMYFLPIERDELANSPKLTQAPGW